MQLLEVSGAVRPLYGSLGVKGLMYCFNPEDRGCTVIRNVENYLPNDSTYISVDLILHLSHNIFKQFKF